jgi:rsbT antagonist protein RsbS
MERIPILQLGDFLLVSIQVDLHDNLALALQDDLCARVAKTAAKGVVIDISALELVDSFVGRVVAHISGMARILGADTVLVGMRPAVAITLVELGVALGGVCTARDIDSGVRRLRRRIAEADTPGGSGDDVQDRI